MLESAGKASSAETVSALLAAAGLRSGTATEIPQLIAASIDAALRAACESGNAAAVTVLLDAYGDAGCRRVLAAGGSSLLKEAAEKEHAEVVAALLAAYGAPGCPPVLEVLALRDHAVFLDAVQCGREPVVAALLEAYSEPGRAAPLKARKHAACA